MRNWSILLLLLVAGCPSKKTATLATDAASTEARLRADVAALCDERMQGRGVGTPGIDLAAEHITQQFESAGYAAIERPFQAQVNGESVPAKNIFAFRNSSKPIAVMFTAHYDHIGSGEIKSLEINKKGIHPGADDNASGVAVMLELARRLPKLDSLPFNVLFAALSGHEAGLWGSKACVEEKEDWSNKGNLKLVVNMDMVGRLDHLAPTLRLSRCPWVNVDPLMAEDTGIKLRLDEEGETVNDYDVFCKAGYPAISITTGIHADYHRMSDTPEKLNYPGMARVVDWCESMARRRISAMIH